MNLEMVLPSFLIIGIRDQAPHPDIIKIVLGLTNITRQGLENNQDYSILKR